MFKMVHGLLIGVQLRCIYSKEQSGTCRTDEPKVDAKRKVDLKWDDYFMAMACLASTRRGSWKENQWYDIYISCIPTKYNYFLQIAIAG